MTTTVESEAALGFPVGEDPVLGYLSEVLPALGGVASGRGRIEDAARVERISMLEMGVTA
jgi:hypothetical protein